MIKAGRVSVDGEPAHLGQKIDAATARVEVDGLPLPVAPDAVHVVVNKPVGVVSTAADPQGRRTITELVDLPIRVYPVGRLDVDSEGLIIVTNDGTLTERLTHPRYGVTKTYLTLVRGSVGRAVLQRLTSGVSLDDGVAVATAARLVDATPDKSAVEIIMTEGRKREVRRMFEVVGHPVERLVRTAIGPLTDSSLRPGEWRHLTVDEVRALYAASGFADE